MAMFFSQVSLYRSGLEDVNFYELFLCAFLCGSFKDLDPSFKFSIFSQVLICRTVNILENGLLINRESLQIKKTTDSVLLSLFNAQQFLRPLARLKHGLQSRPPSPKRAERKVRRRPFREAGSGQNNETR